MLLDKNKTKLWIAPVTDNRGDWLELDRHTHKLCTLVSVAFRFNRLEFGFPGSPYIMAKLIELLFEI